MVRRRKGQSLAMFAEANLTAVYQGSERRRLSRARTMMSATAYLGSWRDRTPCVVRDLHEHGARIRLSDAYPQDVLEVELDIFDSRRRGRVVWVRGKEVGLTFEAHTSTADRQIEVLKNTLRNMGRSVG